MTDPIARKTYLVAIVGERLRGSAGSGRGVCARPWHSIKAHVAGPPISKLDAPVTEGRLTTACVTEYVILTQ